MYVDMYGSTFTGKQLNNLQKVKDFYAEQVSLYTSLALIVRVRH